MQCIAQTSMMRGGRKVGNHSATAHRPRSHGTGRSVDSVTFGLINGASESATFYSASYPLSLSIIYIHQNTYFYKPLPSEIVGVKMS